MCRRGNRLHPQGIMSPTVHRTVDGSFANGVDAAVNGSELRGESGAAPVMEWRAKRA